MLCVSAARFATANLIDDGGVSIPAIRSIQIRFDCYEATGGAVTLILKDNEVDRKVGGLPLEVVSPAVVSSVILKVVDHAVDEVNLLGEHDFAKRYWLRHKDCFGVIEHPKCGKVESHIRLLIVTEVGGDLIGLGSLHWTIATEVGVTGEIVLKTLFARRGIGIVRVVRGPASEHRHTDHDGDDGYHHTDDQPGRPLPWVVSHRWRWRYSWWW